MLPIQNPRLRHIATIETISDAKSSHGIGMQIESFLWALFYALMDKIYNFVSWLFEQGESQERQETET